MTDEATEHQPVKNKRVRKGLVIVNTGHGKGKTTASLGVMLRAWGRGMRVQMFQFLKPASSNFGEHRAARKLGVPIQALGDGFTWRSKDPVHTRALALEQWEHCRQAIQSGQFDIVILDELTYTLHYGWLAVEDVLEVLRQRDPLMHVIITGRHAPAELIDFADLVTDMQVIKHPYREQGVKAQPGIEF